MLPPDPERRLRKIRESLTWVEGETWFYNLDNYRPDAQVERELQAIASHRPADITVCEVIGNRLPELAGYTLICDDSTESRENIAAYVRDDLPLRGHYWVDLDGTWPRTKRSGIHPARSYLVLQIGRMQKIVAHQPPKGLANTWTLQLEGINALARVMAPWKRAAWRRDRHQLVRVIAQLRPRFLVWDANRKSGENGPGPDTLATRVRGVVHGGDRIDSGLTRGAIEVLDVRKFGRVRVKDTEVVVELKSDHRGAIRFRWRVRAYWLPQRP